MVWAMGGGPRLVLPGAFWKRLDADQQAALVIHELAHLRRGDHWVRLLEILCTGLFWWHPALWWARRGLHEAEEQCCDLWVVWAMPLAARTYATALVETVDFLCEGSSPLPVGASGMGQVHDLSRRIGMIMRGTTPRAMSRSGWLMMLGLTALLLPLRPSWSQQPKPEEMPPPAPPAATPSPDPLADPNPLPPAVEDPSLTPAQQQLKRAEDRLRWAEEMFAKKYVSQAQLTADRLAVEAARREAQADARLKFAEAKWKRLDAAPAGAVTEDAADKARAEFEAVKREIKAEERAISTPLPGPATSLSN